MSIETATEQLSRIQDEIIGYTWGQVGDSVDRFYIQGKITDDGSGNILGVEGNLKYVIVGDDVLRSIDVVSDDEFRDNAAYTRPLIVELHDVLYALQGKSPVRFRWSVDTKTRQMESVWTYYDDLTADEKQDDFWKSWKGDFAWKAQLEAELAGQ